MAISKDKDKHNDRDHNERHLEHKVDKILKIVTLLNEKLNHWHGEQLKDYTKRIKKLTKNIKNSTIT